MRSREGKQPGHRHFFRDLREISKNCLVPTQQLRKPSPLPQSKGFAHLPSSSDLGVPLLVRSQSRITGRDSLQGPAMPRSA